VEPPFAGEVRTGLVSAPSGLHGSFVDERNEAGEDARPPPCHERDSGTDPFRSFAGRRFHAILLNIDHSPRNLLHPRHGTFYSPAGLRALAAHLEPNGVFALWSDDPPDDDFLHALQAVFTTAQAHILKFANPLLDRESASTVYVARMAI
jgi:hypothetical protein